MVIERFEKFRQQLNKPVDPASLALFRIGFGALMACALVRFLAKGWVHDLFIEPTWFFPFTGFEWIKPLPSPWIYFHVFLLLAAAIGIALGWRFRLSATIFFFGFTYLELIDKTNYLNHYYLVSILAGLLIFLPADRPWSLSRSSKKGEPIPVWTVYLLRFQLAVVYFFAGLAKLNSDWLLEAQPLRIWLAARDDLPLIGSLMDEVWVAYAASWTGFVYDLTIAAFLLWPRTRPAAYVAVLLFHLATALLFPIGLFPWLMMVATPIFFQPSWPRRFFKSRSVPQLNPVPNPSTPLPIPILLPLAIFALLQIVFPLRHLAYEGPVAWDYRGFNFSWRVMAAEKAGFASFMVTDASGQWKEVRPEERLTSLQAKMMAQDPEMIRCFAQSLAAEYRERGWNDVRVTVDAWASLNGKPSKRLINPEVDFARELPDCWILPWR
ncbi:MAG: HTTM domain-containing protein [Verrucomicrobiota bacterium]|nr:HTTM domain-containing protein [Verrucomicrobiota bacterium]